VPSQSVLLHDGDSVTAATIDLPPDADVGYEFDHAGRRWWITGKEANEETAKAFNLRSFRAWVCEPIE
jgi:hypothetical protein